MKKTYQYLLLLYSLLAGSCIEPFTFEVKNEEPPLVIESYISDVSYNESLQYPSDGRYFTTKLSFGKFT